MAVAFLRFDGTDTVLAEDGADTLTTAVDEVLRNVQQAAVAHDIFFLDTDVDVNGGKILLVGGAPRSAGDDTDRLLTAVRETRRSGWPAAIAGRHIARPGVHRRYRLPHSPDVFGKGRCRKPCRPACRACRVRLHPHGSRRAGAHPSVVRGQ